jgi:hypothetical protein
MRLSSNELCVLSLLISFSLSLPFFLPLPPTPRLPATQGGSSPFEHARDIKRTPPLYPLESGEKNCEKGREAVRRGGRGRDKEGGGRKRSLFLFAHTERRKANISNVKKKSPFLERRVGKETLRQNLDDASNSAEFIMQ